MGKLTVIGSTNLDMIMQLERMPNPGETLLGGHYSTAPGGKGANQAVAAARAGEADPDHLDEAIANHCV